LTFGDGTDFRDGDEFRHVISVALGEVALREDGVRESW
jgi:hypothetical protein